MCTDHARCFCWNSFFSSSFLLLCKNPSLANCCQLGDSVLLTFLLHHISFFDLINLLILYFITWLKWQFLFLNYYFLTFIDVFLLLLSSSSLLVFCKSAPHNIFQKQSSLVWIFLTEHYLTMSPSLKCLCKRQTTHVWAWLGKLGIGKPAMERSQETEERSTSWEIDASEWRICPRSEKRAHMQLVWRRKQSGRHQGLKSSARMPPGVGSFTQENYSPSFSNWRTNRCIQKKPSLSDSFLLIERFSFHFKRMIYWLISRNPE